MNTLNTKILSSIVLLAIVAGGCNTTKGMGRDMEQTGQNIKETVEKND